VLCRETGTAIKPETCWTQAVRPVRHAWVLFLVDAQMMMAQEPEGANNATRRLAEQTYERFIQEMREEYQEQE